MTDLRSRLDSGETLLGMCNMFGSEGIIERIGGDWDFIWVDGQHGLIDAGQLPGIVRACDLAGTQALIRLAWLEPGAIGRALDTGAAGVIVPCIDTPEEARAAVDAAKFPPEGRRSYGSRRQIDRAGRTYSDTANHDQMLVVQIESPAAVEAAAEIAAVPGVDALMIGPDDLMLRRGISMSEPRVPSLMRKDMEAIATAATDNKKFALGLGFDEAMISLNMELGFKMIVCGADTAFLTAGSKSASSLGRKLVDGASDARPPEAGGHGPY